jgi:parallel beta-helix repeat protein
LTKNAFNNKMAYNRMGNKKHKKGECYMKRKTTVTLIFLSLFLLINPNVFFGTVEAATNVNGIITSDAIWTKENSPYSLTGPVGVSQGATLTIEPGTTVNLNNYYIIVNGSLVAKGIGTDKVQINGIEGSPPGIPLGSSLAISYTYGITINNYNQYSSGSTFENAIINSVRIALGSYGKINNCTINGFVSAGQSSIISNSLVTGLIFAGGNSQVLNNGINGGIQAEYGSPIISDNVISGSGRGNGIWFYLSDNIAISGNTINGCDQGIFAQGGNGVIDRNFISDNTNGITISYGAAVMVQKNTIEKNQIGLQVGSDSSPAVTYNNLDNSCNIYLSSSVNINAANNWWGTTNETIIGQTIHDSKNDFNLGTVTFVPFLTEANPQAMPETGMPTPTPTATSNPTPSQSASLSPNPTSTSNQSGEGIIAFLGLGLTVIVISLLSLITVLLVFIVIFLWKRRIK